MVLTRLQAPPSNITSIQLLQNGQAQITGSGIADLEYTIEASVDLTTWEVIGTATAAPNGIYHFIDPEAANLPYRFYRAVSP